MPDEEFQFLAETAGSVNATAPLPAVSRVSAPTDRGEVSALRWGLEPARVVLLHGAALNAHTWDATVLSWGVDALAVDLPGHGDSARRADRDYTPGALAPAVAQALSRWSDAGLLSPRFALVGQSLGGLTAVAIDNLAGERVSHVVLVDIVPLPADVVSATGDFLAGPTRFGSRDEIVRRAEAFGLGGDRASLVRAVHLNTRRDADGSIVWKHDLAGVGPGAVLRGDPARAWRQLEDAPGPVDLVYAGHGLVDDDALAEFHRRRPGARALRVESGHNIQEDEPALLARRLATLLPDV